MAVLIKIGAIPNFLAMHYSFLAAQTNAIAHEYKVKQLYLGFSLPTMERAVGSNAFACSKGRGGNRLDLTIG